MALTAGTRIGVYEVTTQIGEGGMGQVWRARDTKLNRDVALKVLPDSFANDPDRLARFTREAQTLAALNHPNIAHIHGLEESGGVRALVMELVEGEDLSQRIARGAIPIDEVLPIAKQIAEALEAAHEQGIIHRDLKPANIKVRDDGRVKVLDFGLAKALEPAGVSAVVPSPPTITSPAMTQLGMILGTAAYMAPEQARGKSVDKRTDIWAFGCVLYEMLAGRRTFEDEDVSLTLSRVLQREPDWSALPANTPAHLRTLLRRCLQKDVSKRLPHIGVARLEIDEEPAEASSQPLATATLPTPVKHSWLRRAVLGLCVLLACLLAGAAGWYLRPASQHGIARFQVLLPDGVTGGNGRRLLTASPDGSEFVFVGASGALYRRPLASGLAPTLVAGTEGFGVVTNPVFSPDGRSVAFWSPSDSTIKRIAVAGGAAQTVTRAPNPFGMFWGPDGLTVGLGPGGIARVTEIPGGTLQVIVKVAADERAESPQVLPDGDHVLFTLYRGVNPELTWESAQIVVQSISTNERNAVLDGAADARYLPTGHLVYAVAGNLLAVGFNVKRLKVEGDRVSVVEGVRRAPGALTRVAHYTVSADGSLLVFLPGPSSGFTRMGFALTDRRGDTVPLNVPPGPFEYPRISPDDSRIAFGTNREGEAYISVYDLSGRSEPRRLTFEGKNRYPVWSDATHVTFQSDRGGDLGLWSQPANGSGDPEHLTTAQAGDAHVPEAWSPAGDRLLFSVANNSGYSLFVYSREDHQTKPLGIHSEQPLTASFSPDGRWVAYAVAAGIQTRVYVASFPAMTPFFEVPGSPARLAHHPLWSRDSPLELLFVGAIGTLYSARVTTTPSFTFESTENVAGRRRKFADASPTTPRTFDITRDGRILGLSAPGQNMSSTFNEIHVVLNWTEELKRLVPTK